MQGTWKENLSGYNHKDTKRKKQSRKHTVKYKYQGFLKASLRKDKKLSSSIFKIEPIIEETTYLDKGTSFNQKAYIFDTKFTFRKDFRHWKEGYKIYESVLLKTFSEVDKYPYEPIVYNTGLYYYEYLNLYTHTMERANNYASSYDIKRMFDVKIEILKLNKIITWALNDNKRFSIKKREYFSECSKTFIYGKPINKSLLSKKFLRNENSKYFQKYMNSKDRVELRNWIKNANWDKSLNFKGTYYGYYNY
ncbi:hypothetical protein HOK00_03535 [bacterium]|nr:hypothetical protein [bacterium]